MSDSRSQLLQRVIGDVTANGLGDRSLRDIATAVSSSHRMLIYHFGSRDGLVAAIVEEVERQQRAMLGADPGADPTDIIRALWRRVSDPTLRPFVQLFFEAVAYSSRRNDTTTTSTERTRALPHDGTVTTSWLDEVAALSKRMGRRTHPADVRLGIAVVRGLLLDVVAGGDLKGATASLERFLAGWSLPVNTAKPRRATRKQGI